MLARQLPLAPIHNLLGTLLQSLHILHQLPSQLPVPPLQRLAQQVFWS